jgi:rhamnulokinase
MVSVVRDACREGGWGEPQTPGDFARCICHSLAASYLHAIEDLRKLTGMDFKAINIIGGGRENTYLNELTATACKIPVYAGPAEGTALGNIISQMLTFEQFPSIEAARKTIRNSFDIKEVRP